MNGKELRRVWDIVDNEGFDYAFSSYTDFKVEVQDEEFHRLRVAFLNARQALVDYVGLEDEDVLTLA